MAQCGSSSSSSSSSSITKQGRVAGLCCGIAWADENQAEESARNAATLEK